MDEVQRLRDLLDELENFQEIAKMIKPGPGEIPELRGVAIDGLSLPLHGAVGGDHVIYLDFNLRYDLDARIDTALREKRPDVAYQLRLNRQRAGILVADVAGHRITDALVGAMLHQAFLLGTYYELDMFGQITSRLFAHMTTRFYESTSIRKFLTMVYGEIHESGRFRYISAGHHPPVVFSREFGTVQKLGQERTNAGLPIGVLPSGSDTDTRRFRHLERLAEAYQVNEIDLLGQGDLLLLHTDGLSEHDDGRYMAERLAPFLRTVAHLAPHEICPALRDDLLAWAPPEDDITFVVVKKL